MDDDEHSTTSPGNATSTLAAPSSSPPPVGESAWNPAHRPDSDSRPARTTSSRGGDDFFDQLADHSVEAPEHPEHPEEEQDVEDELLETRAEGQSMPVEETTEQLEHPTVALADAEEAPSSEAAAQATQDDHDDDSSVPGTTIEDILGDNEALAYQREEAAGEQKQAPEHLTLNPDALYISSPGMTTPVAHDVEMENELAKYRDQGESYEHQGHLTQMEEAVDEAPTAPLLEDEEAPPTVEEETSQSQRAPRMQAVEEDSLLEDMDGTPAYGTPLPKAKAMLGQIDRSFTTNFIEAPARHEEEQQEEHEHEEQRPDSSDWPSAGDDKTFGELLDNEHSASSHDAQSMAVDPVSKPQSDPWGPADEEDAFGELLGTSHSPAATGVPVAQSEQVLPLEAPMTAPEDTTEDDLAAAFASVLLDDDMLEDPKDMDMSAIFGDDDPGFLDDELLTDTPPVSAPAPVLPPVHSIPGMQRGSSPYIPSAAQSRGSQLNSYAAPGSSFTQQQNHGRSAGTPSTGLYDVYGHGAVQQQPPPQRPAAQTAQSFVDKAKGGYQSPYDLPMDVAAPKQRPRPAAPVAPPRSSSISSSHQIPPPVQRASSGPPVSAGFVPPVPPLPAGNGVAAPKGPTRQASGFFEDLPVVSKARARPSGAYTPQPQSTPQHQLPPQGPSGLPMQQPQRPQAPPTPAQQSAYGGFTQPEKLPLLPDEPTASISLQPPVAAPTTNQRYSPNTLPAPSQAQNRFSPAPSAQAPPAGSARYSPAPPAQVAAKKYGPVAAAAPGRPSIQSAHSFAPRTSSPLAFHGRPQPNLNEQLPASPPKSNGRASPAVMSPQRSGSLGYSPSASRAPSLGNIASPPQRPMTQSPPTQMKVSKYAAQVPTEAPTSTITSAPPSQRSHMTHRKQFSREVIFVPPQDEHARDPLQRWKGHPIFKWGDSGVVISSLPKQTPFWAAGGGGVPSVKCTPGAITVQQATTFMPLDELSAKFPGPLSWKAKKKKDVLGWMSAKIEALRQRADAVRMDFDVEPDLKKRVDEKLTLWQVMKIFVDHDGKLEGDRKIEEELRAVLLPNLAQMSQAMELSSPVDTRGGLQADGVDRAVVVQLRQALLEGQRERAVWLAEEKKLWGHAMLIASTMGPETWQQIVQSFVRSQVKTVGSDARSLAALYQVFANNAEECVDELVPPSARAGFQMMSKTEGAVSKNPLEGLDQWQETLGLIASNRTPADGNSLLALGKLLSGYGRAEAAHTCFLFARVLAKHTGADDPEATFVLLGANHQRPEESLGSDLDSIILTEIYEWALSLSQHRAEYIPHLQAYKLKHAQELAAAGLTSQAQAYCDHITKAYQSTTKPSQYYHPTFTQTVADLSAFLSQTPQTGPQGLLSKVSSAKVSSSASSWFTKFVSGDDDQTSNASGAGSDAVGPFGGVNGDSPDISRVGSSSDMHQVFNPMMGSGVPTYGQPGVSALTQQFQPSSAPMQQYQPSPAPGSSRYAPGGTASGHKYAPMSAGSLSSNEQRPGTSSSRSYAPSPQPLSVPRPEIYKSTSDDSIPYGNDSRRGSGQFSSGSYEPRPLLAEQPVSHSYSPLVQHQESTPYAPQSTFSDTPNGLPTSAVGQSEEDGGNSYAPPAASGYDPGSSYGYEPPAYVPYEPEPETEEPEAKPKPRRGIMDDDDDDDILARAAAIKTSSPAPSAGMSKSEADRLADEAFRKAAEADAARDADKKGSEKKGWGIGLGGWFGGKKGADQGMPQQQSGPIKAKLGEENSFFFDKDLGKWVNKKDPKGAETASAATPPPPKGPPSRNVSSGAMMMGPPSGPPSRITSGSGGPMKIPATSSSIAGSGPPSRVGTPAAGTPPTSSALTNPAISALNGGGLMQPPSRPGTSLSNASSIDDLMGGPPVPRKGGTLKKGKKGGRYVDVMAK